MNEEEQKALRYLVEQGINAEDVLFRYNKTPDFLLPNGRKVEVKKVRGRSKRSIAFSHSQYEKLKKEGDVVVLAYDDGDDPIFEASFSELGDEYEGISIHVYQTPKKGMTTIQLSRHTYRRLEKIKKLRGYRSYNGVIRHVLDACDALTFLMKSGAGVRGVEHVWTDEEFTEHFKWLDEEKKKRMKEVCRDCLRWVDGQCTETTVAVHKVFPNCFLKKEKNKGFTTV